MTAKQRKPAPSENEIAHQARASALEEAARLVLNFSSVSESFRTEIATRIRALKSEKP
jgi:hypothetical protein